MQCPYKIKATHIGEVWLLYLVYPNDRDNWMVDPRVFTRISFYRFMKDIEDHGYGEVPLAVRTMLKYDGETLWLVYDYGDLSPLHEDPIPGCQELFDVLESIAG